MAPTDTTPDTGDLAASTQHKRAPTEPLSKDPPKRPTNRSNAKSATDYLLGENRTGSVNEYPRKKRRYIVLHSEGMMNALATLYSFFFQYRWNHFRHLENKRANDTVSATCDQLAIIYLSHWMEDTYRTIRESLVQIDPNAFRDMFFEQLGHHSDYYDNFLSTLNAHLRPTHIINALSDCIYIPLFHKIKKDTGKAAFTWTRKNFNLNLFMSITQIMSDKKVAKMTPLSSDLLGRPSWLFDWTQDGTAYAWFPQEGNYNDEDVALAYIIGEACTPKLAQADFDEWKYSTQKPNLNNQTTINAYNRVTKRRWYGNSEYRIAEIEPVHLPDYSEKDPTARTADNHGPLQLYTDVTAAPVASPTDQGQSSSTDEVLADIEENTAPPSPRYNTRSATTRNVTITTKYWRTRVIDRMYYAKVVLQTDQATRHTAFRMFNKSD